MHLNLTCIVCGSPFTVRQRRSADPRHNRHCSRKCAWVTRRAEITAPTFEERFWRNVSTGGVCRLEWRGGASRYGSIRSSGTRKTIGAHVASYELHVGPVPRGMAVCHTCDRGAEGCVTPEHFFLGTKADNQADMGRKGRAGGRKLTDGQVRQIRILLSEGIRKATLARQFNISQSEMGRLARGAVYKYVA